MTNCAHTKKGKRMNVRPLARSWMMVVMKLTAPSSDEVIRKIIPMSHIVWPMPARTERGVYDVHPDWAAPPGVTKLASIVTPPRKKNQ